MFPSYRIDNRLNFALFPVSLVHLIFRLVFKRSVHNPPSMEIPYGGRLGSTGLSYIKELFSCHDCEQKVC